MTVGAVVEASHRCPHVATATLECSDGVLVLKNELPGFVLLTYVPRDVGNGPVVAENALKNQLAISYGMSFQTTKCLIYAQ